MNREIKFSAWSTDTEEMIPWEEAMFPEWFEDDTIIPLQFTGLHDKNGKEIYYNCDVVKINYPYNGGWIDLITVFTFNDEEQRTELDVYGHPQYTSLWFDCMKMKDREIIGNRWQNPELLNQ